MYGKKGYQDLLDDIYQGRTVLILKAAVSYLGSEYYQVARGLFQRVIKLDRGNLVARFLFLYASGFNCYFKNRFSMAKMFADEALAIPMDGYTEMETYAQSLRDLLSDLAKEAGRAGQHKEDKRRAYL
jgi:hypothetical protein